MINPACTRKLVFKTMEWQMEELNGKEIEEVSGGNMPESSVGGDGVW